MADLDAGELAVEVRAGSSGFRVAGRFSSVTDGDLPVFDFVLVDDQGTTRIASDGDRVVIESGGTGLELTDDEARSLRLGDDEGFADLGIASWVDDPREQPRGQTTLVSGRVDVADLLADVARIAALVVQGDVEPLGEAGLEDLAGRAGTSSITVVIGADGVPRSVEATVEFADPAAEGLARLLGRGAGAALEVVVTLEPLDPSFTVELPSEMR